MNCEIFISYKCSDENGNKTPDCEISKELYDTLTGLGYSVFFSSDTLEKLGSSRYKADIDCALDTARIMIVVLTKAEYASSQWVRYEWDSFYNDYLSGVRSEAYLYTLTSGVSLHSLPRTLRNVQNFDFAEGLQRLCGYVMNILPVSVPQPNAPTAKAESDDKHIHIITGRRVTVEDIHEAVLLDALVYDEIYRVDTALCEAWFEVNPDIYVMAKDSRTNKVIAYINVSPVTDECYERIRNGDFNDSEINADMLLSYDMPYPYSVYFSSIVIHPDYQNTEVLMRLFNAVTEKFIRLGEHEVYVRRMIADAVTKNGEKFCRLFGMNKVGGSCHESTLYEITMIPPKFRVLSKTAKQLYDYYQMKYNEAPYLFRDE